jgi:hypothetical protein
MSTYNKNKLLTFEISSRSRFCYLNSLKKFEVGLITKEEKKNGNIYWAPNTRSLGQIIIRI